MTRTALHWYEHTIDTLYTFRVLYLPLDYSAKLETSGFHMGSATLFFEDHTGLGQGMFFK